ncbi:MAG TPA: UDP-phosphate glucose phosphotransferase, partial [Clostridiales bacterium]|nr:UDP-phosphate glucose phosphotransferase [Clostridiales bacterium]
MYKAFKWVMDRLLALVALLVTGPFIALLALAVAIDSPGNPFMVQKRDGYKRKTIKVIKFRTMFSTNVAFDVDHAVIASDN